MVKELEEGVTWDGQTSDRELHNTHPRQIRVEPSPGRTTDDPMEEPTRSVLEMDQVPILSELMDSQTDKKAVECCLGYVVALEQHVT